MLFHGLGCVFGETYDCNGAIGTEQILETEEEIFCEKLEGLGPAGEDIVDDVVVARFGGLLQGFDFDDRVAYYGSVVRW